MENLKHKTIRGGLARVCGQGISFLITFANVTIMARLLSPNDYGLVSMATSITGIYAIFASAGLSTVTIQRVTVSDEQMSVIFWINLLVGTFFAVLCLATAPIVAKFYNEPRLFWVTVILGVGFIINALGIQHSALLQRQLRFVTLTLIETASRGLSLLIGIVMALMGFGYWALIAANIAAPAVISALVWITAAWTPGRPIRGVGIWSMLRFGGTLTLNGLVSYLTYNLDMILLGRFWGPEVVGFYNRAYWLMRFPTETLNIAAGSVTFSALSRLQEDPDRLKSYFLKGYLLVNSLTLPTTIFCALFSHDIISVILGAKWLEAEPIFRLLTPTILIFEIINPLGWLLVSIGLLERSLKLALVMAPLVISAYLIGLPYGPQGVAFCYSAVMALWLFPHIMLCIRGTIFTLKDILFAMGRPFLSALIAGGGTFAAVNYFGELHSPFLRLAVAGTIMFILYYFLLLFVMGQKVLYLDLIRGLLPVPQSPSEPTYGENGS